MFEPSLIGGQPLPDFFNQEMARGYDERNSRLAAISENLHFLVRLVLADLPPRARVLCVGVGTGAEILSLAEANPGWSFVGVDPSAGMLDACRTRLKEAGFLDRCELVQGYIQDVPADSDFDAVVSILVAHFVPREERARLYRNIHDRLKPGGMFVSAEISFDLASAEFPAMLKTWERVQGLMGATPDSLRTLGDTLRNALFVLSPAETEALWKESGFSLPIRFFQSFMITGWHVEKG